MTPDDPCNGGIDHGVQPEWYRNVAVQFPPGSDDPVFPDPDDVELVTVAATPVSGIDACLGAGPGAGADAVPGIGSPHDHSAHDGTPTTAPSSTAGAGAQAGDDDDDSGSDASVVITSSGDSSGSGGSDAAATTTGAASNGSLAHTGTGVSGPVLAGVMLIACGAMVLAARRREHRFA